MSEQEKKIGLVIYGDGSARPNPGFIGSGAMGYTYHIGETSEKFDKYGEYQTTDNGYMKRKPGPMDRANGELKGNTVKPIEYYELAIPSEEQGTNNLAELRAIYEGLRQIWDKTISKVTVVCDSEYTLNVLRRDMNSWAKNGWLKSTGDAPSNVGMVKELHQLVTSIIAAGVEIKYAWVRGHSDIAGNVQADILSNIGRDMSVSRKYNSELITYTPKEYNDYTVEKHPFLTHKRVYFITKPEQNIPGFYFQGDSGAGDFMIGKRLPETGYSVIILNEPDKTVEQLKARQYEYAAGLTQISSLLLDKAFDKKTFRYIDKYGMHCTEKDKRNTNVNFFDGKPLTMVMNPTGLSLRAIDCFNTLTESLRLYMVNKEAMSEGEIESKRHTVKDITDVFYEKATKKVAGQEVEYLVLRKDYATGAKNVTLDHEVSVDGVMKPIKVALIFGTDLPDRNQVKRLEKLNPKIKLITWRHSENSVNYAVIIDCDDAVGIWSNFYADQVIIS